MNKVKNKNKLILTTLVILLIASSLAFLNSTVDGAIEGKTDTYLLSKEKDIELIKHSEYDYEYRFTVSPKGAKKSTIFLHPKFSFKDMNGKEVNPYYLSGTVQINTNGAGWPQEVQQDEWGNKFPLSDYHMDDETIVKLPIPVNSEEQVEIIVSVKFDKDSDENKSIIGGEVLFNPIVTGYQHLSK